MERKTLEKSYTDKYQKHVGCSYGVDDKFSNSKSYLHEDIIYSMIDESKYCSDVMKVHTSKKLP